MKQMICILGLILSIAFLPDTASADKLDYSNTPEYSLITVTGRAETTTSPDLAIVRLGAESQAKTARTAQSMVNKTVTSSVRRIEELGIPQEQIQTATMQLYPVYAPTQTGAETEIPRIVGYRASNTIQIRLKQMDRIGEVIDLAVESGANRIESVSFELEEELPHKKKALQLAAEQAQTKAKAVAETLDLQLHRIHKVVEGEINIISPQPHTGMERAMADAASTPVQPGQVQIEASVSIEYLFVPTEEMPSAAGAGKEEP